MTAIYTSVRKRLERAFRRLGTRNPVCVACGEGYPHALERHHLAGIRYHGDTAIVCRNCHRKVSDPQHDREGLDRGDSQSERIGHYLCGLGDCWALIAATVSGFGQELLGLSTHQEKEGGQ